MENVHIPKHVRQLMFEAVIGSYPAIVQSGHTASEAMRDMIRAYHLALQESGDVKAVHHQSQNERVQRANDEGTKHEDEPNPQSPLRLIWH